MKRGPGAPPGPLPISRKTGIAGVYWNRPQSGGRTIILNTATMEAAEGVSEELSTTA